jgi:hypothetical protein
MASEIVKLETSLFRTARNFCLQWHLQLLQSLDDLEMMDLKSEVKLSTSEYVDHSEQWLVMKLLMVEDMTVSGISYKILMDAAKKTIHT